MNTTLDSVIERLTQLRDELGEDARVHMRETKQVTYSGGEIRPTKEVIIIIHA